MLGKLFVRFLCAVLGVAAALAVLELGARFLLPTWAPTHSSQDFWVNDATLGWRNRPGVQGRMDHVDFSVDIQANSQGLRDTEYPLERVAGKRRWVVLGDSFGWGFGVEQDETFCERIEARRDDVEFINGSVSGWSNDQQVLWYERDGRAYQPDVVLVLVCFNDFTDNVRTFGGHKPRFELVPDEGLVLRGTPIPGPSLSDRIRRAIDGNTYLLRRVYGKLSPNPTEAELTVEGNEAAVERMRTSSELTRALYVKLNELTSEDGAQLVVASIPMHEGLRLYLRDVLGPLGVPYLELDEMFAQAQQPTKFERDLHWTPYGHALAADAIEAFAVELGLLEE